MSTDGTRSHCVPETTSDIMEDRIQDFGTPGPAEDSAVHKKHRQRTSHTNADAHRAPRHAQQVNEKGDGGGRDEDNRKHSEAKAQNGNLSAKG